MGGAQPLAATMAGASLLAVECRPSRIEFRLRTGYLDVAAKNLDEALAIIERATKTRKAGLGRRCSATPPKCCPNCVRRGVRPDIVTDQTSAHDPVNGYLPKGWTLRAMGGAARERPQGRRARRASVDGRARARHARPISTPAFRPSTTATTSARWRWKRASRDAFDFPGFVPAYIRPLFCRGIGPFRWAALSGDPEDIYRTDAKVKELMPDNAHLHNWLDMARARIQFQGLPARICWVGPRRPPSPRPRLQRDGGARAN